MERTHFISFLTIFIFAFYGFLFSTSLTIQECLQRAQENSYLLKSEIRRAEVAENDFQAEKSMALPQFSGELSNEQRYLAPYNFRQSWALVHADWLVGNFLLNTPQASGQEVLMAKAQIEQTRLQVLRHVALLYIDILQTQIHTHLLYQRLDLLKKHYNIAEALWRAGTRNRLDVLQTESEISQLQEQIAVLDIEGENFWQELSRLIGWDSSDTPQFTTLNSAEICAKPLPAFEETLLAEQPLLQFLSFRLSAEKIRSKSVTAWQLPRLHLAGGYIADADPTGDGNYWRVDAGISLPLFQWDLTKFQKQKSEALIQSVEDLKMNVERELTINVQQILKKLNKLKNVLQLQENRVKTAEETFRYAEDNYQAGIITHLDYMAAQHQLVESQITIQKRRLDYVMNLIDYYVITHQVDKIEVI
jgi:outer membrane protein TolC